MKRIEVFGKIKKVVIKIGTNVITLPGDGLDLKRIEKIVQEVVRLQQQGYEPILVSSGAIGAGMGKLGLKEKPRTIPLKQAAAAIGQGRLMQAYEELFSKHNLTVAQVLLTQDDMNNRKRYSNAYNTLQTLLNYRVVPIINENDTVAVEEIKVGDNDTLSALVTNLIGADLLIILTDVDGLYSADPRKDPQAKLIKVVEHITPEMEAITDEAGSQVGIGGMYTKIQAAKKVTSSGVGMVIANGKVDGIIEAIISGQEVGTLFLPREDKMASRKRWIAFTLKPQGSIIVDAGAREAIVNKGKSLLPSGIISIEGEFEIGESVSVKGDGDKEFARGLVNYNSEELQKIKGAKTKDIESILGYKYFDEVIHRDNLVVL